MTSITESTRLMDDQDTEGPTEKVTQQPAGGAGLKRRLLKFAPLAVIAAGLVAAYAFGLQEVFSLSWLADRRDDLNMMVADHWWPSILGFTLAYFLATAFSFPAASILTIFGGFLFGWFAAGIAVAIGATAGATAIFMVARTSIGSFLRERMPKRVKALAEGYESDAFSYLLVLRLAPIFPFFVSNIAPALFDVKVRTYVAATLIGILPGVFAYTWLGQGVGSVLDAAREAGREPSVSDLVTTEITIAFVALAVVAALPLAVRKLRGNAATGTRNR